MPPQPEVLAHECVNCHFLYYSHRTTWKQVPFNQEMRRDVLRGEFDWSRWTRHSVGCQRGEWAIEGSKLASSVKECLRIDRGDTCPFLPFRSGLSFAQAWDSMQTRQQMRQVERELVTAREELANGRRSLTIALWALIVAIVLVGLQLLAQLLSFFDLRHKNTVLLSALALVAFAVVFWYVWRRVKSETHDLRLADVLRQHATRILKRGRFPAILAHRAALTAEDAATEEE